MGQSKKRRPCPVVSRDITSAECGENRLSRYACPEGCAFDPFSPANYSAVLEIEDRVDRATMKRYGESPAQASALLEAIDSAQRRNPGHGAHAAAVWHFYFARDAAGRTFAERWSDARFSGLNNDERVLFQGKMRMRVVLLEVHRVIDGQSLEAVDLLEANPAPLGFVDRSLAARAARFSTILTWAYPLPHFWRMSGTGIDLSHMNMPFTAREMIEECVAHLGGPAELEPKRRWLAEYFARLDAALVATGTERRRHMFAGIDASIGAATYELRAAWPECRAALAKDANVDQDELHGDERAKDFTAALVWFEPEDAGGSAPAPLPGRRALGRVLLGPKEARLEAIGGARLDELKARFEARLGARVRFSKERRDNVGVRMGAEEPPADPTLVPPRLLERPMQFDLSTSRQPAPPAGVSLEDFSAMLKQEFRRDLLDQPMPALDGRTPRQAAAEPGLRARLVEVMKTHVHALDEENLQTGRNDDINALIRELGLAEIDFPPPPRRPPPADDDIGDDEPDDDEGPATVPDESRPAAPRLFGPPLTKERAIEAFDRAMSDFEMAADALDELNASGAGLIDHVNELSNGMLDETEFNVLVTLLLPAWFALVPQGVRAPRLDADAMAAECARLCDRLGKGGEIARDTFGDLPQMCRQPAILELVAARMIEAVGRGGKGIKIEREAVPVMIVIAKVIIDAQDAALRRSG